MDSQVPEVNEEISVDNELVGNDVELNELPEDLLKDGDTVLVGNLEEVHLDSDDEQIEFEQVERETFVGREWNDSNREFSEELFFGSMELETDEED